MNDAELVRRTLAGQTDAYAELSRRWAAFTAICHARVRRADVANDWLRKLFSAASASGGLTDHNKVGTWLMGIATGPVWTGSRPRNAAPFPSVP